MILNQLDKERYKNFSDIDFAELCITSNAEINKSEDNQVVVKTQKAKGTKCPVCWKIKEGKCPRHS